jgi:GT2 family glycosyltransferase
MKFMKTPAISFVITTMNRKNDLKKCLDSIFRQVYENKEIIIVDNASTDGTGNMLQSDYPSVKVLTQSRNEGVAGGRSIGIQHAQGAYIIQLDDDESFLNPNVCEQVIDYFQQYPQVGVLSFNIINPETGITAASMIPRRDKRMLHQDAVVGYFLGGGCAFRKEVLDDVGYYWLKLNPYGSEELDLAIRIVERGWQILWTKGIGIYHYESPVSRAKDRRTYFEARNRVWVALKHLPWLFVLTHFIAWWVYVGLIAFKSGTLRSYCRGVRDSLAGIPLILRERKVVSKATISYLRENSGPLYY